MSAREEPLHSRGERPAGDRLPRALLRDATSPTTSPPSSRTSSTTSPAAGSTGRNCWRNSGAISSRRPARSWSRSRPRSPPRSTISSRPGSSAARGRQRSAALPGLRQRPAGAARRPVRRVRRLLQLSRVPLHAGSARAARQARQRRARRISATGIELEERPLRSLYPWATARSKRASIPKECRSTSRCGNGGAAAVAAAEIGAHPETGKPITASIGRYGPYLAHDGKYARLGSTAEVFETGMNAAVAKLADAASGGGRGTAPRVNRSRCSARIPAAAGDQADGRPLRPLRHRRDDPCDLAEDARIRSR